MFSLIYISVFSITLYFKEADYRQSQSLSANAMIVSNIKKSFAVRDLIEWMLLASRMGEESSPNAPLRNSREEHIDRLSQQVKWTVESSQLDVFCCFVSLFHFWSFFA